MDRLTSMAVFVSVIDEGSFTAAANVHSISPTMVAKHIAFLEKRLNARLLHRTTRRLGVTEAGRVFATHCRRLLSDFAEAEASASALMHEPAGRLRISAPVAFGSRKVTPLVVAYLERYPEVEIDLVLADRKVDLIQDGFDIAFRIGPIEDDWLVARPLAPYEMMLAASPSYLDKYGVPNIPDDLAGHSLLGFSQWSSDQLWTLIGPDGPQEVKLKPPRLHINTGDALRAAAVAGFGIILQSAVTLEDDLLAGRLQRVLPRYMPPARPMHLVYLPDRRASVAIQMFIAMATGQPA